MTTCLGKICSFGLLPMSFVNVYQCVCVCVCISFPFGFESGVWDLVVLTPDHFLLFCFPECQYQTSSNVHALSETVYSKSSDRVWSRQCTIFQGSCKRFNAFNKNKTEDVLGVKGQQIDFIKILDTKERWITTRGLQGELKTACGVNVSDKTIQNRLRPEIFRSRCLAVRIALRQHHVETIATDMFSGLDTIITSDVFGVLKF